MSSVRIIATRDGQEFEVTIEKPTIKAQSGKEVRSTLREALTEAVTAIERAAAIGPSIERWEGIHVEVDGMSIGKRQYVNLESSYGEGARVVVGPSA